jgi:ABC-type nitrate/sulfonate/bicarbonate transport system substrate-binding protein
MAQQKLQIRFNTFGTNAAVAIAEARGLFNDAGLAVETIITRSSTEQMRGLSQGHFHIASTAFDNVLAWSGREGADIHAIKQASERIYLPVYVRPEIHDWEDLRGRVLAVDAVDTAYALVLRRILLAHDLDLTKGDYEFDGVGATGPRFESMQSGAAFAAILNSPWDARAEAVGMKRFADYREVLPDYPGGVFAVTTKWASDHHAELVAFLKCVTQATRWGNDPANETEALKLLSGTRGLDRNAAAKELAQLPKQEGLNLEGLQVVLDLRVQFGMTPSKGPNLATYYDLQYYNEACS